MFAFSAPQRPLRPRLFAAAALVLAAPAAHAADAAAAPPVVPARWWSTASRLDLLGVAATASQGSVTEKELFLRPVYRVGQAL